MSTSNTESVNKLPAIDDTDFLMNSFKKFSTSTENLHATSISSNSIKSKKFAEIQKLKNYNIKDQCDRLSSANHSLLLYEDIYEEHIGNKETNFDKNLYNPLIMDDKLLFDYQQYDYKTVVDSIPAKDNERKYVRIPGKKNRILMNSTKIYSKLPIKKSENDVWQDIDILKNNKEGEGYLLKYSKNSTNKFNNILFGTNAEQEFIQKTANMQNQDDNKDITNVQVESLNTSKKASIKLNKADDFDNPNQNSNLMHLRTFITHKTNHTSLESNTNVDNINQNNLINVNHQKILNTPNKRKPIIPSTYETIVFSPIPCIYSKDDNNKEENPLNNIYNKETRDSLDNNNNNVFNSKGNRLLLSHAGKKDQKLNSLFAINKDNKYPLLIEKPKTAGALSFNTSENQPNWARNLLFKDKTEKINFEILKSKQITQSEIRKEELPALTKEFENDHSILDCSKNESSLKNTVSKIENKSLHVLSSNDKNGNTRSTKVPKSDNKEKEKETEKEKEKKVIKANNIGQLPRNEREIEKIVKSKNIMNHNICMVEYNKRRGLNERTKIFCFNSQDEHIRRALKKFGWVENALFSSTFFHLKWGYNDSEEIYKNLKDGQYYNHFLNNQCITTKSGLNEKLRGYIEHSVDIYDFFPRCFDLGNGIQIKELAEDYERTSLIILFRKHWEYFKTFSKEKAIQAKERFKTKELGKQIEKKFKSKKPPKYAYFYEELHITDTLIVHIELLEKAIACVRSLVKQYKDVADGDSLNSFNNLNKISKQRMMRYSLYDPPYHKLKKDEMKLLGGTSECWQTPNLLCVYKIYKFKKLLKKYVYQYSIDGSKNLWIVKPSGNARGSGIYLTNDINDCIANASKNQARIVQKYIEKPFIIKDSGFPLLNKKKFDIRQWVLVTSFKPLKIYFFNSCYLRICSANFDLNEIKDLYRHLTNFSINKTNFKNNLDESICDLQTFINYLRLSQNISWDEQIKPKIKDIIIKTLLSCCEDIEQRNQCFELYGFDIMLDKNLKPWLIEVNLSPACNERTPWLTIMLDKMAEGLFKICLPKDYFKITDELDTKIEEGYITQEYYNSINHDPFYSWELIYEGEEYKEYIPNNTNFLNLEISGVKANVKKEKELDKKYYEHIASLKIQKNVRIFFMKSRLHRIRRTKYAIIIQKYMRMFLSKIRLNELKQQKAIQIIKDVLKIKKAKDMFNNLKRNKMCIKIQSQWRRYLAQKLKNKLYKLKCLIKIQSLCRKYLAIKQKIKLKEKLRKIKKIQVWWKLKIKKIKKNIVKIQSLARMIRPKKILKQLKHEHFNAKTLQCFFRLTCSVLKHKNTKCEILSTKLIQKFELKKKLTFMRTLRKQTTVGIIERLMTKHIFQKFLIRLTNYAENRYEKAKKIQALYRMVKAKHTVIALRRKLSAIKIQAFIRMTLNKIHYKKQNKILKSVKKIQKFMNIAIMKIRLKKMFITITKQKIERKKLEESLKKRFLLEAINDKEKESEKEKNKGKIEKIEKIEKISSNIKKNDMLKKSSKELNENKELLKINSNSEIKPLKIKSKSKILPEKKNLDNKFSSKNEKIGMNTTINIKMKSFLIRPMSIDQPYKIDLNMIDCKSDYTTSKYHRQLEHDDDDDDIDTNFSLYDHFSKNSKPICKQLSCIQGSFQKIKKNNLTKIRDLNPKKQSRNYFFKEIYRIEVFTINYMFLILSVLKISIKITLSSVQFTNIFQEKKVIYSQIQYLKKIHLAFSSNYISDIGYITPLIMDLLKNHMPLEEDILIEEDGGLISKDKINIDNEEFEFMMPLDAIIKLRPFVDRYFIKYYQVFENNNEKCLNQYAFCHTNKSTYQNVIFIDYHRLKNRLFMVGLAKEHQIIKNKLKILKISYDIITKGMALEVRGKKKKGGMKINPKTPICQIYCEGDQVYTIYGIVDGSIIELNEAIIANPNLLLEFPESKGYIAIINSGKYMSKIEKITQLLIPEITYRENIDNKQWNIYIVSYFILKKQMHCQHKV